MPAKFHLGIDTGGTFTDFVLLSPTGIKVHKVLSTPDDPAAAIRQGILELDLIDRIRQDEVSIIHGTTVATNTTLEGKGVRTAYITNRGLGDLLTIGRQTRAKLYDLQPEAVHPPVSKDLIIETGGRLSANGDVVESLTSEDLLQLNRQLQQIKPESVAINLLFSFVDDRFEKAIEAAIHQETSRHSDQELFISRSSHVLPEFREYERGIATWLNAWLGPIIKRYILELKEVVEPSPLAIMQSSGGTIGANQAATRAVNLLLSGPAGGLAGSKYMGELNQNRRLITFDMGGTSTDVALIDQQIRLTSEGRIGPYPIAIPMADMHTIGAGGGSIATIDAGGLLQVGPESAGASPGPACYGLGGTTATVTDANTVLGRLQADAFLGGRMHLDVDAARKAVGIVAAQMGMTVEDAAEGIVELANENMIQALRVISIERGYDPKEFQLVCFGGAGGLHFCALAEALQINQALVPIYAGVLSAFGMLVAPPMRQFSRTHRRLLAELDEKVLRDLFQQLKNSGIKELSDEGVKPGSIVSEASLDLRYQGQSYTLNLPYHDDPLVDGPLLEVIAEEFHQQHQRSYGHRLHRAVELLNLRLSLRAPGTDIVLPKLRHVPSDSPVKQAALYGFSTAVNIYRREMLAAGATVAGPALITETLSTTLIQPGWTATVDEFGNMLLTHHSYSDAGSSQAATT